MIHINIFTIDAPELPELGCTECEGKFVRVTAITGSDGAIKFTDPTDVLDVGFSIGAELARHLDAFRESNAHVHVCIEFGRGHEDASAHKTEDATLDLVH